MKSSVAQSLTLTISLIVTFAATPLRQVEAASDQARVATEDAADQSVELTDGGVGDDSDATIRPQVAATSVALALLSDWLSPLFLAFEVNSPGTSRFDDNPRLGLSPLTLRLARLQRFRF